jgi:hypothetical protein
MRDDLILQIAYLHTLQFLEQTMPLSFLVIMHPSGFLHERMQVIPEGIIS